MLGAAPLEGRAGAQIGAVARGTLPARPPLAAPRWPLGLDRWSSHSQRGALLLRRRCLPRYPGAGQDARALELRERAVGAPRHARRARGAVKNPPQVAL